MLSYIEHAHSKRPSTTLTIWAIFMLFSEAVNVRTMWLAHQEQAITIVKTATLPVLLLAAVLESLPKSNFVDCIFAPYSKEESVGIVNRSFFWWLNPLFIYGYKHKLRPEDLPPIDSMLLSGRASPRLREQQTKTLKDGDSGSLLVNSLQAYSSNILRGALLRLLLALFTISQPLLINSTTQWFDEPTGPVSDAIGYGLIAAYLVVFLGRAISTALGEHQSYRLITMVRSGLTCLICDKTLRLSLVDAEKSASLTLMSTDIERIGQGLQFVHEIWATPVEFAVALYLLAREVGLGCLAPMAIVILSIVGTALLGMRIDPHQKKWIDAIERRIASTTDMLRKMKSIKMSGLEDAVMENIQRMRIKEVDISQLTKALFIGCSVLSTFTATLSPVLGFMIYVLIQKAKSDSSLAASNAFTSLALFSILSASVNIFITAVPAIFAAISCFGRIEAFLASTDNNPNPNLGDDASQESTSSIEKFDMSTLSTDAPSHDQARNNDRGLLSIENGTVQWQQQTEPLLSGINLMVKKREFLHITGPMGCGKTSLLYALLGEAPLVAGRLRYKASGAAFCQQTPWLPDVSVKDCILGQKKWDKECYDGVIAACALSDDLLKLPGGDQALVGNSGANLSGGQRQRVALARAVYSRRPLVLLDDVLSALDANTAKHVSTHLFSPTGLFRKHGTTVVYTGNSAADQYADSVLAIGTEGRSADIEKASTQIDQKPGKIDISRKSDKRLNIVDQEEPLSSSQITTRQGNERPQEQTRTFSTTLYYLKSCGIVLSCTVCGLSVLYSFFLNFPTIWVNIWIQADMAHPYQDLGMYLGVYALCAALALATNSTATWFALIRMVKRSAEGLHDVLLKTVANAPLSYFASTEIGTITNHFSQDMEKVDIEIPLTGIQALFAFTSALVQIIILSIGTRYTAIAFPFIVSIIVVIQRVYLQTSRQLRIMDLEAKSPLYSHFTELLAGLATIRAFGFQEQCRATNAARLDYSQAPFYLLYCAQRWLTLVLNLVVGAMAILMMGISIKLRGTVGAGDIGLAFVNLMTFSQSIQALLTWWTMMEASIGAVQRVQAFDKETGREDDGKELSTPPKSWPAKGSIDIRDVTASYTDNGSPVLRNVTLSIAHGQKIGVCGRTGSGKTSLILSMLRLIDLNSGSVLVDSIDLARLPAKLVRQRIVTISQDPLSLKDTVRRNLDPASNYTDEQLQRKLQRVGLWDLINSKGGLDASMHDGLLSHGQRQLFCLARALLQSSSIVIMDEVTSSADKESQDLISRIITEDLYDATVITIAHKLEDMGNHDRIIVLDNGQIIEQGSPQDLLGRNDSVFRNLWMEQREGRSKP
ncbi:hypothetical protein PDE_02130 [Penicillium oxalicum 114-2]|uniref:ABC transporter n=1 Tax=Penicillium oxalicum (strain 114-2 / CGMCC 5302) TaxID=933388 RepID=S8AYX6_PENO1|nr:hypothetical protein PDE_02130 [Penicillium oxalicum 114-2]